MGTSVRAVRGIELPREGEYLPGKQLAPAKLPHKKTSGGIHRLTDAQIKSAKPGAVLRDGKSLYLVVSTSGAKLWRQDVRLPGKKNSQPYSIGQYPDVSLAEARARGAEARAWAAKGLNPTVQRKVEKALAGAQQAITYRAIAEEWYAGQLKGVSDAHGKAQRRLLDRFLLPSLGDLPFSEVEAPHYLEMLRTIERTGAHELLAKSRVLAGQISRYSIATGRRATDPTAALKGAFKRPPVTNRATVPAAELPSLFRALAKVPAEINTKLAMYWLVLTAARTSEMRFATWGEIHGKTWRIPAARMKMAREHVVPLSRQALEILDRAVEIRATPDAGALLFPGFTRHGALSENALLALLARAGFFGRQTGHGFRASFSTWANEVREADPDVIEACLAHAKNDVRGAYNRSTYLSRRLELLQAWADQCSAWGMKLP